jgi:protein EFR3
MSQSLLAVERFSGHDAQLTAGPSPLIKLSPQLMHIENLSLSSLARGARGVGVTELREALDGRSGASTTRLPNASASTLDHFSQGHHHQLSLQRTRSRPQTGGGRGITRAKENAGDVRELLAKIGLGKEGNNSLLKASFPKPDTK